MDPSYSDDTDDVIEYLPPHLRGVKLFLPTPLVPASINARASVPPHPALRAPVPRRIPDVTRSQLLNKDKENIRRPHRALATASNDLLPPSEYKLSTRQSTEYSWRKDDKKDDIASAVSSAAPSIAPLPEVRYNRALSTAYSESTTNHSVSENLWQKGNHQKTPKAAPSTSKVAAPLSKVAAPLSKAAAPSSKAAAPPPKTAATAPSARLPQRALSVTSTDLLPPTEHNWAKGGKPGPTIASVVEEKPAPSGSLPSKEVTPSRDLDYQAHIERVREEIRKAEASRGQKKPKGPSEKKIIKAHACIFFDDCEQQYDSSVDLKKHMHEIHEYCQICKIDFKNHDDLLMHKLKTPRHIACPYCAEDFNTSRGRDRHVRQSHISEQNIECPGCHEVFTRAGALLDHIEKNICTKYTSDRLEMNRAMGASHLTQWVVADPDPEATGSRHSRHSQSGTGKTTKPDTDLMTAMDTISEKEGEAAFEQAFPALGSGLSLKNLNPTAKKEGPNAAELIDLAEPKKLPETPASENGSNWNNAQPLHRAPPSVRTWVPETNSNPKWNPDKFGEHDMPNLEKLVLGPKVKLTARTLTDANDVRLDIGSAEFNAEKFRNSLGRYACPHPQCGKTFLSVADFKSHLESPAHRGVDHRCPGCLKIFKSATAITQHLESPSTRCKVQSLNIFQQTVTLVSGGFLDASSGENDKPVFKAEEPKW
ncbi:MAG: hypothetical protein MMC33_003685 [Icmadophila ericetorum]|nr:hypothetical protein [Icmadophila ericetorum]